MEELRYDDMLLRIPEDVYLPSDDSFLLARHAKTLKGGFLEVGCGSGIVSLSNAKANPNNMVLGVDINPSAVSASEQNAKLNDLPNAQFLYSDLFSKLGGKSFDAIVFNPPYLPTSKGERLSGAINAAFDGGPKGRDTLDRFLGQFSHHLNDGGTIILIHSSLNDSKQTISKLQDQGLGTDILEEKSFFFEKLMVLKATKP